MTSYDGLTLTPTRGLSRTTVPAARRVMPVWLPMAAWALGLVAVVVGAAFGGTFLVLSSFAVIALVAGMAVTAARWRRVERLAELELAERRASASETQLV
ncbi:hypothetical protein [Frigoribacterium sp. Leaf186]|uniref:hypothetical protein n=1 Tax=Frigoribacterium sp. Leaf186 TaxID=1736293 RepID=UPI0007010410|nr:hypothetical protein [Frigoribacterium sp. Leaf186]KQS15821.1 hypothetical protein ASG05_13870 [Frigoribacterium sp. Leaf186]